MKTTAKEVRIALRKYVENFYDFQERRLQTAGRTHPENIELHELDKVRLERAAKDLETAEKNALGDVLSALKRIPFYKDILSDKKRFRGLGPTMAGVILSSFDIEREDTVSQMWAFAGLRPMPCLRCAACHSPVEVDEGGKSIHPTYKLKKLVVPSSTLSLEETDETKTVKRSRKSGDDVTETLKKAKCVESFKRYDSAKAQRPIAGQKLTYNKWLRTKLVGVLGPCLIKANSPWRTFYDNYKHRKASAGWGMSDGHRHNAAIRYMIKMLLIEIHRDWRTYEGLPVRRPYHEEYLGHVPSKDASHPPDDTQERNASHNTDETHKRNASQDDDNAAIDAARIDEELALVERMEQELASE